MRTIERLCHGLVVSCQAWPDSPLHSPVYMAVMAEAVAQGGAAGIRANGADDIGAIRQRVSLPIIGIQKSYDAAGELWITATCEEAGAVARAGADIIAVDSRRAQRPDGSHLGDLFAWVHDKLGLPVMADIATFDEAVRAQSLGAEVVATTFAIQNRESPDFDLLYQLTQSLTIPVIAEGLYWTPGEVCRALDLGAYAVVVGTAITRPDDITRRFMAAIQGRPLPEPLKGA